MLNKPVSDLNLSVRARKCMNRLGINTLGELIQRTADELLESKNFGMTSLTEVREKLRAVWADAAGRRLMQNRQNQNAIDQFVQFCIRIPHSACLHQVFTSMLLHTDMRPARQAVRRPTASSRRPMFMPVGTQATVKGLTPAQLRDAIGVQIILGNTYHLALRPGDELIAELGGLHRFMGWDGPILTD